MWNAMENMAENSEKIEISKKIVKWYEKYGRKVIWNVNWFGKYRRK